MRLKSIPLAVAILLLPLSVGASEHSPKQRFAQNSPQNGANQAQEFSEKHLKLAYQAVFITRTSRAYNEVIPNLVRRAKAQLVEKYPKLEREINQVIEESALKLAERQDELDLAISRNWAARYSEAELREITDFYATPTGTKLARQNTELIAAGLEEARKWGALIGRDMIDDVVKKLEAAGHQL